MSTPEPRIPVLAYHSVADEHDHPWNVLSLPVGIFERQLRYLRAAGFNTITLYELYEHLRNGAALPQRPIVLTFDDGYLDNWVHAFPLLEKYDARATVFVATDFVDGAEKRRPHLGDVWAGRAAREDLRWWGYASWPELEAMQASGRVDVQSHSRTHTWYFTGEEIVDFHHPADDYPWLSWNRSPETKPHWLTRDVRAAVPWGSPVYRFDKTLVARRYFDDPGLATALTGFVSANGAEAFFSNPGWRETLHAVASEYRAANPAAGHHETDAQRNARLRNELAGSRETIAARLDKPVDFLCWPGNTYTPDLHRFAIEECGYLATVHTPQSPNRRGDDPTEVRRSYFGQEYQGPMRSPLVFLNFYGTVNYQRGRALAYPLAPVSRRLMKACKLFERRR